MGEPLRKAWKVLDTLICQVSPALCHSLALCLGFFTCDGDGNTCIHSSSP